MRRGSPCGRRAFFLPRGRGVWLHTYAQGMAPRCVAHLDLSGASSPVEAMRALREEIERTIGLRCSIGIGPNKLVAKVASDAEKPNGFVVLSEQQARQRFAASPCKLIPGIGPRTGERL